MDGKEGNCCSGQATGVGTCTGITEEGACTGAGGGWNAGANSCSDITESWCTDAGGAWALTETPSCDLNPTTDSTGECPAGCSNSCECPEADNDIKYTPPPCISKENNFINILIKLLFDIQRTEKSEKDDQEKLNEITYSIMKLTELRLKLNNINPDKAEPPTGESFSGPGEFYLSKEDIDRYINRTGSIGLPSPPTTTYKYYGGVEPLPLESCLTFKDQGECNENSCEWNEKEHACRLPDHQECMRKVNYEIEDTWTCVPVPSDGLGVCVDINGNRVLYDNDNLDDPSSTHDSLVAANICDSSGAWDVIDYSYLNEFPLYSPWAKINKDGIEEGKRINVEGVINNEHVINSGIIVRIREIDNDKVDIFVDWDGDTLDPIHGGDNVNYYISDYSIEDNCIYDESNGYVANNTNTIMRKEAMDNNIMNEIFKDLPAKNNRITSNGCDNSGDVGEFCDSFSTETECISFKWQTDSQPTSEDNICVWDTGTTTSCVKNDNQKCEYPDLVLVNSVDYSEGEPYIHTVSNMKYSKGSATIIIGYYDHNDLKKDEVFIDGYLQQQSNDSLKNLEEVRRVSFSKVGDSDDNILKTEHYDIRSGSVKIHSANTMEIEIEGISPGDISDKYYDASNLLYRVAGFDSGADLADRILYVESIQFHDITMEIELTDSLPIDQMYKINDIINIKKIHDNSEVIEFRNVFNPSIKENDNIYCQITKLSGNKITVNNISRNNSGPYFHSRDDTMQNYSPPINSNKSGTDDNKWTFTNVLTALGTTDINLNNWIVEFIVTVGDKTENKKGRIKNYVSSTSDSIGEIEYWVDDGYQKLGSVIDTAETIDITSIYYPHPDFPFQEGKSILEITPYIRNSITKKLTYKSYTGSVGDDIEYFKGIDNKKLCDMNNGIWEDLDCKTHSYSLSSLDICEKNGLKWMPDSNTCVKELTAEDDIYKPEPDGDGTYCTRKTTLNTEEAAPSDPCPSCNYNVTEGGEGDEGIRECEEKTNLDCMKKNEINCNLDPGCEYYKDRMEPPSAGLLPQASFECKIKDGVGQNASRCITNTNKESCEEDNCEWQCPFTPDSRNQPGYKVKKSIDGSNLTVTLNDQTSDYYSPLDLTVECDYGWERYPASELKANCVENLDADSRTPPSAHTHRIELSGCRKMIHCSDNKVGESMINPGFLSDLEIENVPDEFIIGTGNNRELDPTKIPNNDGSYPCIVPSKLIDKADEEKGWNKEVCCMTEGLCSGNTDDTKDITCPSGRVLKKVYYGDSTELLPAKGSTFDECCVVPGAPTITIPLDADYDEIAGGEGTVQRDAFEENFKTDILTILNASDHIDITITSEMIEILNIGEGSIVVTFKVNKDVSGNVILEDQVTKAVSPGTPFTSVGAVSNAAPSYKPFDPKSKYFYWSDALNAGVTLDQLISTVFLIVCIISSLFAVLALLLK